jgi:hypothetical protein
MSADQFDSAKIAEAQKLLSALHKDSEELGILAGKIESVCQCSCSVI